ncbi:MAG: ammonia channel protein [Candidatus Aquicultor secundus]|nr:ammonium transporter [Candidatus Aquicultor secundus]OIO86704.1 MAG: ammonia channel protein [Candidatus Aquicultor secundus]
MQNINTGDTAWMLISTALVMFMTPGLALFYGGMVRNKNVLGTLMHSFIMLGVGTIVWILYGYSLAFGPDKFHIIGDLSWIGLKGVGMAPNADYAATIPHILFMAFQMMFAVITPALITGAFAERIKFSSFLVFMVAWMTFIYSPVAHWVWGVDGWIRNLGALDFAGGTVVHINAAFAALAAALIIGKRKGFGKEAMQPHNLPMTLTGAAILWFGWFGFNAGSALTSGGLAAVAFVVTHVATASAALGWILIEKIKTGKPTTLGAASGAVAGLVAITPASGYVGPLAAVAIGFTAGIVCYLAIGLKFKLGYDDSLDVVGIHGVGGIIGALLTGVFATTVINPAGFNGLLHGNPKQVLIQLVAILVTIGYSFIGSGIILKVIDAVMGLRVSEEDEVTGLDLSQHNETGYALGGFGGGTMEHGIPGSAVLRPETSFTMQAHPANKPQ